MAVIRLTADFCSVPSREVRGRSNPSTQPQPAQPTGAGGMVLRSATTIIQIDPHASTRYRRMKTSSKDALRGRPDRQGKDRL